MNRDQIKKNLWARVQLLPVACRLDKDDRELAPIDDDWIIEEISDAGVHISNPVTGHKTILGYDHIHHYTSNPSRSKGEIQYGFLTLNVQIFLQGNSLSVRPTRPGEPLKSPRVEIVEKWVDIRYPFDSGIQGRLESEGYRLRWCYDANLSRRVDLEGWEIVVEPDAQGVRAKFRMRDLPGNQTLIKKRNG